MKKFFGLGILTLGIVSLMVTGIYSDIKNHTIEKAMLSDYDVVRLYLSHNKEIDGYYYIHIADRTMFDDDIITYVAYHGDEIIDCGQMDVEYYRDLYVNR